MTSLAMARYIMYVERLLVGENNVKFTEMLVLVDGHQQVALIMCKYAAGPWAMMVWWWRKYHQ